MFAASFVALALAAVGAHAQLQLNTPGAGLTECQNFQFSWQGNTGPVQILVYPNGVTSGPPLETLPTVQGGTTVVWLVDQPANTNYTFALKDLTTGQTVFSGAGFVSANPSGDVSCQGKNTQGDPAATGSSTAASGTPAPGDSTTAPASPASSSSPVSGGSSTAAGGASSTKPSTTGSTSATATPNSASSLGASAVAGLFGIVAAFIFA